MSLSLDQYKKLVDRANKKPRKSDRQKLIYRLDCLFSEYIRKRAIKEAGGCQRCYAPKLSYLELQCAHMFSRKGFTVRWNPDDACGICGGCHLYIDSHPIEKIDFFKGLLGETKFQALNITAHMTGKTDLKLVELYLEKLLETV